jgi:hypothetical protein
VSSVECRGLDEGFESRTEEEVERPGSSGRELEEGVESRAEEEGVERPESRVESWKRIWSRETRVEGWMKKRESSGEGVLAQVSHG